jgi:filamentous hemagglutinin
MNNKVSDSINDRLNTSYNQIRNNYKSIVDLTSLNFKCDTTDNSVTIKKSKFGIDTSFNGIMLGNPGNLDSMILYGTSSTTVLEQLEPSAPNGSLFLTQNNIGEIYIKNNDNWKIIGDSDNITGNITVNNNLSIDENLTILSNLEASGNIHTYDLSENNFNSDVIINDTLLSKNITCKDINTSGMHLRNFINCSGEINTQDITSYSKIKGNNLNINSKTNIDLSGNIYLSGNINSTGNIYLAPYDIESNIITNLNINSKAYIDQSGNIDLSNNLNTSGIIIINGNINSTGNITSQELINSSTSLNVNNKLNVDNDGNLNTSGSIITNNSIITNSSISGNTLNINNKLSILDNGTLNASGNINISGDLFYDGSLNVIGSFIYSSFNINLKTNLNSNGNIDTCGNISASGNIINSGNIVSTGLLNTDSLNINELSLIDVSGSINIQGNINASGNINTIGLINNLKLTPRSTGFSISGGTIPKILTVNNTLTFSGTDNTTISLPSTSIIGLTDSQNITNKSIKLNIGTVFQAPLQFTAGTNLTNALEGVMEYDGANYYASSNDCNFSVIRKFMPTLSYFRILDDISKNFNPTSDLFENSTFSMDADAYYIIEWHIFISRDVFFSITYSIVTSTTPVYINIEPINIVPYNASNLDFSTISEDSSSYSGYRVIRAYILNDSTNGATVKLQAFCQGGIVTLKQGSHIIIKRMPNGNFGTFTV